MLSYWLALIFTHKAERVRGRETQTQTDRQTDRDRAKRIENQRTEKYISNAKY